MLTRGRPSRGHPRSGGLPARDRRPGAGLNPYIDAGRRPGITLPEVVMMGLKLVAVAVLTAVGVLTWAGQADAAKGKKKAGAATAALFAKLDADGDGKLSKDEFAKLRGDPAPAQGKK